MRGSTGDSEPEVTADARGLYADAFALLQESIDLSGGTATRITAAVR